jgi:hypothetical protein
MKVKFNGGIKDVAISEVTAENYIVPQREEKFYHVKQEKVEFDRNTGKRLSRAVIQKYDKKAYVTTVKYLQDAGYTITVLHDPVAWEKANAAARINAQRVAAEKRAAAEKQKADAEREAMKAELRKEMKAELLKELKDELKANKETKGTGRGGNRKNGKGAAAETTETPEETAEGTENENND